MAFIRSRFLDACAAALPKEPLGGVRVEQGIPWRSLRAEAAAQNADLIVIASHGYSGLDHLLETTAARVVNHADRPVLVVRTP